MSLYLCNCLILFQTKLLSSVHTALIFVSLQDSGFQTGTVVMMVMMMTIMMMIVMMMMVMMMMNVCGRLALTWMLARCTKCAWVSMAMARSGILTSLRVHLGIWSG